MIDPIIVDEARRERKIHPARLLNAIADRITDRVNERVAEEAARAGVKKGVLEPPAVRVRATELERRGLIPKRV
jgi:hypothetical protein